MRPAWAVGLMTGTVLDGEIDVALIRTDGESIAEFGAFELVPNPPKLNTLLAQTLEQARRWGFEGPEPEIFAQAERALTEAQSQAVLDVVGRAGLEMDQIHVVGFHGQSVLHRAPVPGRIGATRQLGDGAMMAERIGADVVFDLRGADVAAGGQGAPLAPIYHVALLERINAGTDAAVLNLGGVANLTWRGSDGTIVGFDTGPANAPINDFIGARGLGPMDRDGLLARRGKVDEALLERQLDHHAYLTQPYPKSLDRFDFGHEWVAGLSDQDGAATLTAFSAAAVGKALDVLPARPQRLIVSGGGRRNPCLMDELGRRAGVVAVPAEDFGWRGDAIEAECFAFLAMRSLRGLPLSFPMTTGVPAATSGGQLARYRRPD